MPVLREDSEFVSHYHYSGTQHGIGVFPLQTILSTDGWRGQHRFICMDYSQLHRSVLHNLDQWVAYDTLPPPSLHPRHEGGTAQESNEVMLNFAKLPGLKLPERLARV